MSNSNNGKTCKNCGHKYWDWDRCCQEPLFDIKSNKYLVTINKRKTKLKFKTPLSFEEIINAILKDDSLKEADDNLLELSIVRIKEVKSE